MRIGDPVEVNGVNMRQLCLSLSLLSVTVLVPSLSEAQAPPSNIQFGVGGSVTIEPGNSLVNGLGGAAGFGEIGISKGDDGYQQVDISAVFENGLSYFGTVYSGATQFFVGRNGYVTLGVGSGSFTPWGIAGSTVPIIAPFFSDVDTRGTPASHDTGGNSTGSNQIWVDVDPVQDVVTITFDDVGEYSQITSHLNAYQIRLWDLGNGDFGIEFRYEWMEWASHSGWATAGWSAGDQTNYYELPQSGNAGMLDLETSSNVGQDGIWFWQVTGGSVGAFQASVPENSAAGTLVGPLRADDSDPGDTQSFSLLDDAGGRFEIVDAGGTYEVHVAAGADLDYETAEAHTIRVRATDSFGLTYDQDLVIPVTDENEGPTDLAISGANVDEDAAAGTTVGTLSASDPDSGDSATFSILTPGTPFAIAGDELVVGGPLDHETAGSFDLTIRVTDSGGLTWDEVVTITVDDVNEAPSDLALLVDSVDENALDGTLVGTLVTVDQDAGDSHTYQLVTASPFRIEGDQLVVDDALDFEAQTSHTFTVRAIDAGGLEYLEDLTVFVLDINEAPSAIALSSGVVPESAASGTVIGTLSTTDEDAGDTFSYALVTTGVPFAIVGAELQVAGSLDHETQPSFTLSVRSTDAGGLFVDQDVVITVSDVNEAPVQVVLSNGAVDENSAGGTAVGSLSSVDPDSGDTHSYTLLTGGVPFAIAGAELRVAGALDHETQPSFTLTIRSTDAGGLTHDDAFTILVADVNEVPDSLTISNDHVPESSALQTVIGTFTTGDVDAGDTHTYSIQTAGVPFAIAGDELRVGGAIDYEAQSTYSLVIRTTDAGGLTLDETIAIHVDNRNETPTGLVLSSQTVDENTPTGAVVATLTAQDPDAGDTHTFALLTVGAPFTVVGAELRVGGPLDHETLASYNLLFRTTDAGGFSRYDTFTIQVADVNEAPSLPSLSNATIAESAPIGSVLGTLAATDPDAGDSLSYSLAGTPTPFAVAGNELRVAAPLDYESAASHAVTVRVTDSGGLSSEQTFAVQVTDTNEPPSNVLLSNTNVLETAAMGAVVGTLSSVDPDAGDSHTYAITGGGAGFAIVGNELRVAAALDHETAASHPITIRATDAAGASVERAFTITVADVNEAPVGLALSGQSVAENAGPGTLVGVLSASDPDQGDSHTFALVTPGTPFAVEPTGELRVTGPLDYETARDHALAVRVTDSGGLTYERTFTVAVTDLNEAPSQLTLSNTSISEAAAPNTVVGMLAATDEDAGDRHTFSVVTAGAPFAIAGNQLQVSGPLDHEQQAQIALTLRATDSGGLTVDLEVTIDVTDVNEAPSALALSATSIAEDATVGSVVGTLTGSDPDSADTLSFSLVTSGQPFVVSGDELLVAAGLDHETHGSYLLTLRATDAAGLTFDRAFTIAVADVNEAPSDLLLSASAVTENAPVGALVGTFSAVDEDLGDVHTFELLTTNVPFTVAGDELLVSGPLDHESAASYTLWVRVTDAGGLVHDASFTVDVGDFNDPPSGVRITGTSVPENAPLGAVIGTLSAVDADLGDSHTFAVLGDSAFSVSGADLQVAAALDFETEPTHTITVRATDRAGLTYDQVFTITVTDVNEAPTALALQASAVPENAAAGTAVGTLSTSDPDQGDTHTYTLVDGTEVFSIDGATVRVAGPIDFETDESLSFTVRVTDAGGATFEETFTVEVENENDNAPRAEEQRFQVSESATAGTFVGRVAAQDADGDLLAFALASSDASGPFEIEADGGLRVRDASQLDYEVRQSHLLAVGVSDGTFTTTVAIEIAVLDENDTPPALEDAHWVVSETAPAGTVVGTLAATDADGTLSFGITGGNAAGIFAVDAASGEISVADASALDFEIARAHRLQVVADDGTQSARATVFIAVKNENDNPPVLLAQTFSVRTSSPYGEVAGRVVADDLDGGPLHFSISGEAGAFGIDPEQGSLVVLEPALLGDEPAALRVTADDGVHSVEATMQINPTPEGESAPMIADQVFELHETAAAGEVVGHVEAIDPDGDRVTLSIMGGDPRGSFALDAATGVLTLVKPAARGAHLIVQASDGWNRSAATVVVTILEENDHAPRIEPQSLSVEEGARAGQALGRVVATDDDHDALSFAIAGGDLLGAFAIDASAGTLVVASGRLPAETPPSQTLTISVDDGLHTATGTVTVRVTAPGTHAPLVPEQSFSLPEDAAQDTVIGAVVATDRDQDALRYALLAGDEDGLFAVDAASGELRLADATRLDFETETTHTLLVGVTDGWNVAQGVVHVDVLDVNDTPPRFDAQVFSVSERAPLGAPIGTLHAADPEGSGLRFTIDSGGDGAFELDAETGLLALADPTKIDYEQSVGRVIEVAVDDGIFTEHAFVTVRITPENDSAPVADALVLEVPEDVAPGTVLGTLTAADADGDALSWSLTGGDEAGLFGVDAGTGALSAVGTLDYETAHAHTLLVQVTDGWNVTHTTARIVVTNVNDVAPHVDDAVFEVALGSGAGTEVGVVSAFDPEGDRLVFRLEDESGLFSIDADSGALRLAGPLQNGVTLTVAVDDGRFNATGRITVRLMDDTAPGAGVETPMETKGGCNCDTTPSGGSLWALLALIGLVRPRRRRPR